MWIWGPLHLQISLALSHFLSKFSWQRGLSLSLKMGGLKADTNCPLGCMMLCFNRIFFLKLMELQNHLGVCMCKSLDASLRYSVSGGFEWHLKMGISTKWPGDAGWLGGPHCENHCHVHQDFLKDWYSRKMLRVSSCGFSAPLPTQTRRDCTPVQCGKHEFHGSEQPLEGQVVDALLHPQGFAGEGEKKMSRSRLWNGSGSRVPLEWTSCIMSFIILWMDGWFLSFDNNFKNF